MSTKDEKNAEGEVLNELNDSVGKEFPSLPTIGNLCIIREKEFKVVKVTKVVPGKGHYIIKVILNDGARFPIKIEHTLEEFYEKINKTGLYERGLSDEEKAERRNKPFWTFSPSNKLFFETAEDLQAKILEYFESGHRIRSYYDKKESRFVNIKVLTITGLCLYLGFNSRSAFYKYEAKEAFGDTIKRARTFIEMEYEEQLSVGNTAGAIFALKNFGWKDTQTIEGELNNNGTNTLKVEYVEADHSNYDKDGKPIPPESEESST